MIPGFSVDRRQIEQLRKLWAEKKAEKSETKDLDEIKHESSEAAASWDNVGGDGGNQNEDPDYDQNLNLDKFVKCELGDEDFVENSSISQSKKDNFNSDRSKHHHKRLRSRNGRNNKKSTSENSSMENLN